MLGGGGVASLWFWFFIDLSKNVIWHKLFYSDIKFTRPPTVGITLTFVEFVLDCRYIASIRAGLVPYYISNIFSIFLFTESLKLLCTLRCTCSVAQLVIVPTLLPTPSPEMLLRIMSHLGPQFFHKQSLSSSMPPPASELSASLTYWWRIWHLPVAHKN